MAYEKKELSDDPYEHISKAIVLQAVNDYRNEMKKVIANPRNKEALDEVLSIENFIVSGWFQQLCGFDGEYLLKKLREEMAEEKKSKKKIKLRLEAAYEQASARG